MRNVETEYKTPAGWLLIWSEIDPCEKDLVHMIVKMCGMDETEITSYDDEVNIFNYDIGVKVRFKKTSQSLLNEMRWGKNGISGSIIDISTGTDGEYHSHLKEATVNVVGRLIDDFRVNKTQENRGKAYAKIAQILKD